MGFVLYSGTAIALRLGHRVWVDFDLFMEKSLKREALEEAFPFLGRSTVLQEEKILFPLLRLLHREAASRLRFLFWRDWIWPRWDS